MRDGDEASGAVRTAVWQEPEWQMTVGVVTVILLFAAVVGVGGVADATVGRAADDVGQGVLAAIAAAASARTARRSAGRHRTAWAIMAGGLASWTAGQTIWCWYEVVRETTAAFPSVADIGFLGFSASATVAAIFFAGGERVTSRALAVFDGVMVASGLLLLSWCTTLGQVTRVPNDTWLPTLVSAAYPIGDLVLLTAVVQLLTQPRSLRTWVSLFSPAVGCLAVADSGYAYATAAGTYHTGDLIDLGWLGGFALLAVAAASGRQRAQDRLSGTPALRTRRMVMLPYLVIGLVGLVVLGRALGQNVDTTETVLIVVSAALVLARQSLAVRDNQHLLRVVAAREAELSHQAFHDDLTGLPNRAQFNTRIEQALERHAATGRSLAVVFCDLDDFKVVNDTLGHRAGDDLLVDVAERLQTLLPPGDTLARLGGDEFAVLLEHGTPAAAFGRRIIDVLRAPFVLADRQIAITASVGVAVTDGLTEPTVAALLTNADLAMYSTKQAGKGSAAMYRPSMHSSLSDDLAVRYALAQALDEETIDVAYQPVVDPATGAVVGLEALARWVRDGAPVRPDVFVALAERMGVVGRLTDVMLSKAVVQLAEWSSLLGHNRLQVAVNVSALELGDPTLPTRVAAVLSRHAIRSDQVTLEVTESAIMQHADAVARVGGELRQLGVHLAIDDFGAGQSSLVRLATLPFDVLKVDRALVTTAGTSGPSDRILVAVLALADDLGLAVVAEGVETLEQLGALRASGRPFQLQGYLAARPLPASGVPPVLLCGYPELANGVRAPGTPTLF